MSDVLNCDCTNFLISYDVDSQYNHINQRNHNSGYQDINPFTIPISAPGDAASYKIR